MFGRHLRLPVDMSLGVDQPLPTYTRGDWVTHHHQRLTYAFQLAQQKMTSAAARHKQYYDRQAKAAPLVPGERVWLRNRNRQGHGKLCSQWHSEPYVIIECVGNTGLVYKVKQEKGEQVKTLHRNALKPCHTVLNDVSERVDRPTPPEETETGVPCWGFWTQQPPPAAAPPAAPPAPSPTPASSNGPQTSAASGSPRNAAQEPLRRSTRPNLGLPPTRLSL